jgi:cysteinyl-tRNA synthetase
MAWKHLGEQFDIHGGGIDLVFPHHENELAQSCCAFHEERMANVWMHNGFLQVEGEKMSKSLGNFVTIRELLETDKFGGADWDGSVLRFAMMATHYRQPIDWTVKGVDLAFHTLDDLFRAAAPVTSGKPTEAVANALADDLNTSKAVAELHALRKLVRRNSADDPAAVDLANSLAFLGLDSEKFFAWMAKKDSAVLSDVEKIEEKLLRRKSARARKDFKESDRIRDELAAMGVAIKDGKDADGNPTTTWEPMR